MTSNALNKSGHILKRPKVCKTGPPLPPDCPPGTKHIELNVTPLVVFEHGNAQVSGKITDCDSPLRQRITTNWGVSTGTDNGPEYVQNGVPFTFPWNDLTGPPGTECINVLVNWPDSTQGTGQACVDYRS